MNVTLVGKRLCWSDALFYCRDYHWDLLTLRGPAEQEIVDDLVARAPFTPTSHLWVGLRRYWPGLTAQLWVHVDATLGGSLTNNVLASASRASQKVEPCVEATPQRGL